MASGWFRRKRGNLLYCYYNDRGLERSRTIGPATMDDKKARMRVGELKLNQLVGQADLHPIALSSKVTLGMLAEKYLAQRSFRKLSTKELHEQILNKVVVPRWGEYEAQSISVPELKDWFLTLPVKSPTRGKYRIIMGQVFKWAQDEKLIPRYILDGVGFADSNPCKSIHGDEFSQETDYEALAVEVLDTFALLSHLEQPEYECVLLVATCGFRASEALALKWRNILWDKARISICRSFVHGKIQDGAKTKLSRSTVEVPRLVLDVLATWRQETMYAQDDDWVFSSVKLSGRKPRTPTMLVQDYLYPAAVNAGILKLGKDGEYRSKEGNVVQQFGFHNLGRHSLATFLMDNKENPAVVQAVMRHAKMDMTLYYSHSQRKEKRAALDGYAAQIAVPTEKRVHVPGKPLVQ
jgi:integrase